MLSWILNIVNQELSVGIVFASSAALVWQDLKERFDKVNGSRIFFLHRSIATLNQGESIASVYFTRLKLLWDDYSALVPFASCDCEVSQLNHVHLVQQKLFQFLMGLNEMYSTVRSYILLMQPLPLVNQAYSIIVQEESQRVLLSGVLIVETVAMFSNASKSSDHCRYNGVCDYYKIKGHRCDNCYRLIGFPSYFKFTKKKIPQAV